MLKAEKLNKLKKKKKRRQEEEEKKLFYGRWREDWSKVKVKSVKKFFFVYMPYY